MRSWIVIVFVFFTPFTVIYAQQLPTPNGRYAVGTKIFYLSDPTRYDTLFKIDRTTTIQLWYPTSSKNKSALMAYIPERKLADYVVQSKYGNLDSSILASIATLKTHSYKNASIISDGNKFPVLLFSPGLGILRSNYTSLYENLASNGIVVVSIDHMYESSAILPDGRIADIGTYTDTLFSNLYDDCIKDVLQIVTAICNPQSEVGKFLKGHIDKTKISASGHSSGGNIAMCAATADSRISSSVNLDGGDFTCQTQNLTKPTLFLLEKPDYSDEELIKKGRDVGKWRADSLTSMEPFFTILRASSASAFLIKVSQTGHMSFSDAPFLMPQMLTMFLGTYLKPEENLFIISGLIKDFIFGLSKPANQLKDRLNAYNKIRLWSFHT